MPTTGLARGIFRWAAPSVIAEELAGDLWLPLYSSSGRVPDGRRAWFVFNWGWDKQEIILSRPVLDAVSGTSYEAGTNLSLGAWSTRTFLSR